LHRYGGHISRKTDHRFHLKQSEKALILAVDGVKGLAGAYRVLQEVRGNCGE
jgi:hypothetical protein